MKHKDPERMSARVTIVGAGVMGLMSAWLLAQQGFSVSLVECGEIARESSWAGGGILSSLRPWDCPPTVSKLIQRSAKMYPELFDRLERHASVAIERLTPGMLFLNESDLKPAIDWCESNRVHHRMLDPRQVFHLCSIATSAHALYLPEIQSVRNPDLLKALKVSLGDLPNVRFYLNQGVMQLLQADNHIRGVKTAHQIIESDYVLVCAGAWSKDLLASVGVHLPVKPVKGQMLALRGDKAQLKTIVLSQGLYMIPRADGLILVGSTVEHTEFNKETSTQALDALTEFAIGLRPDLAQAPLIKHWSGLRPCLDKGPRVGAVPDIKGLYINTGHYRNGIASAPASAQRIAQLIVEAQAHAGKLTCV